MQVVVINGGGMEQKRQKTISTKSKLAAKVARQAAKFKKSLEDWDPKNPKDCKSIEQEYKALFIGESWLTLKLNEPGINSLVSDLVSIAVLLFEKDSDDNLPSALDILQETLEEISSSTYAPSYLNTFFKKLFPHDTLQVEAAPLAWLNRMANYLRQQFIKNIFEPAVINMLGCIKKDSAADVAFWNGLPLIIASGLFFNINVPSQTQIYEELMGYLDRTISKFPKHEPFAQLYKRQIDILANEPGQQEIPKVVDPIIVPKNTSPLADLPTANGTDQRQRIDVARSGMKKWPNVGSRVIDSSDMRYLPQPWQEYLQGKLVGKDVLPPKDELFDSLCRAYTKGMQAWQEYTSDSDVKNRVIGDIQTAASVTGGLWPLHGNPDVMVSWNRLACDLTQFYLETKLPNAIVVGSPGHHGPGHGFCFLPPANYAKEKPTITIDLDINRHTVEGADPDYIQIFCSQVWPCPSTELKESAPGDSSFDVRQDGGAEKALELLVNCAIKRINTLLEQNLKGQIDILFAIGFDSHIEDASFAKVDGKFRLTQEQYQESIKAILKGIPEEERHRVNIQYKLEGGYNLDLLNYQFSAEGLFGQLATDPWLGVKQSAGLTQCSSATFSPGGSFSSGASSTVPRV